MTETDKDKRSIKSADPRSLFGQNLRKLCQGEKSVSAACAAIGVNRTQFNRYMGGLAHPRPEILLRICRHFGTDARILLEPIETLRAREQDSRPTEPALSYLLNRTDQGDVEAAAVPPGFYMVTRRGILTRDTAVQHLALVFEHAGQRFLRSFEPRIGPHDLRETPPRWRSAVRGLLLPAQNGFVSTLWPKDGTYCLIVSMFRAQTISQGPTWVGAVARSVLETGQPPVTSPVVMERLAQERAAVLAAGRLSGRKPLDSLRPVILRWFERIGAG